MTIDKVDLNKIVNTVGNYDHIIYSTVYTASSKIINLDNFNLFNWSTTFDWGALNLKNYITSMTGTSIFNILM